MAQVVKELFGRLSDGREVELYTLRNDRGTSVKVITYGARLQSWQVTTPKGENYDIVAGYADVAAYEKDNKFMGAIVGRHANRIGGAKFTINGKEYNVDKNDGKNKTNHLHGGDNGFYQKLWRAEVIDAGLKLTCDSQDGESGYPGNMQTEVIYSLLDNDALSISYKAKSDADTICNLTNHAYFNLDGFDSGSVLEEKVQIFADNFTPADDESLPTGEIRSVAGTPMDLRKPVAISLHIDDDYDQLNWGNGYDHNWAINEVPSEVAMEMVALGYDNPQKLKKAAYAEAAKSGITLTTYTTLPGIQFYSGNYLDEDLAGKNGVRFGKRSAFCLETQYFPNALNHPEFMQPILLKGEEFTAQTIYALDYKK